MVATEYPKIAGENTQEWYTPPKHIAMVRRVFGRNIRLDPASSPKANEFVGADVFYTKEQDGLKQDWGFADNVFLNPPYKTMAPWVNKLTHFVYRHYKPAILLANSCTDTDWFHGLIAQEALNPMVCFVKKRIKFLDENGQLQQTGTKPNIFVFLGAKNHSQQGLFIDEFNTIGRVVKL